MSKVQASAPAEAAASVQPPTERAPVPARRTKTRAAAAESVAAAEGTRRGKSAPTGRKVPKAGMVAAPALPEPSPEATCPPPAEREPGVRVALVRDSFTIPEDEYATLVSLKSRLVQMGHETRKTEVVRAGLVALSGLDDASLLAAVQAVPRLATGRPKAKGKAKGKARGG